MTFICLYGINYRISREWDNPVDVGQEVSVVSGQFRHMVRNAEKINTVLILFRPIEKCYAAILC
jgi:hypothetical protein